MDLEGWKLAKQRVSEQLKKVKEDVIKQDGIAQAMSKLLSELNDEAEMQVRHNLLHFCDGPCSMVWTTISHKAKHLQ